MQREEKGAHDDGSTVRQRNRGLLSNRGRLAQSRHRAGGSQEIRPQGRILGDSREGVKHGATKAGAKAEVWQERWEEVSDD